jgi:hypothetical protein
MNFHSLINLIKSVKCYCIFLQGERLFSQMNLLVKSKFWKMYMFQLNFILHSKIYIISSKVLKSKERISILINFLTLSGSGVSICMSNNNIQHHSFMLSIISRFYSIFQEVSSDYYMRSYRIYLTEKNRGILESISDFWFQHELSIYKFFIVT